MGIIGYLVSLAIIGLIIGALGRLVVPGRNPIGTGRTILVGIAGAVVGALIGALLHLGFFSLLLEVGISAGLVRLISGRGRKQLPPASW